jgi:hypothetical protein
MRVLAKISAILVSTLICFLANVALKLLLTWVKVGEYDKNWYWREGKFDEYDKNRHLHKGKFGKCLPIWWVSWILQIWWVYARPFNTYKIRYLYIKQPILSCALVPTFAKQFGKNSPDLPTFAKGSFWEKCDLPL